MGDGIVTKYNTLSEAPPFLALPWLFLIGLVGLRNYMIFMEK